MSLTPLLHLTTRRLTVAGLLTLGALLSWPAAAQVVVVVNGDPITAFDIEQRSKLIQLTAPRTPTRQQVVDELIDEKLKIKEGKKYGL